ncbi:glucose-6-phosphate dehydrogenase assembly protein OpcA [Candidatus Sumerlaeota bacterium]|nr:glucose-6-phosphate dehydrogenase assembly protein OpcA [Candidatus Sumerlaeota bacterium]
MAVDSFAMFLNGHSVTLSPDKIERELSSLWKPAAGKDVETNSVSRVVLGNVLCVSSADQMNRLRAVIQKVVPVYPCRLFLLEYQPDEQGDAIQAAVNAQCFVPKKDEVPVCCEVIHMTFGPNGAKHLHGCVAPLLIADLQTVLWISLGDIDLKQTGDLEQYCDRILVQASLSRKPSALLRRMVDSPQAVFDLSWFRMRPVREQMAAFFDDPANSFQLSRIRRVEISAFTGDGGSLAEIVGAMTVGWLAAKLRWRPVAGGSNGVFKYESPKGPVEIALTAAKPDQAHCGTLETIRMCDCDDRMLEVSLHNTEGGKAMSFRSGREGNWTYQRNISLAENDEADAVGIALNTPSRVFYFRETAALAIPMLEHFKK